LNSLFENATYPELITASIFDQISLKAGEKRCFDAYCEMIGEENCHRNTRLRRNDTIDSADAKGPTHGRYQTEEGVNLDVDTFAMSIDSHTLFLPGWDADLISQWDSIGNPKALLSDYPDQVELMPADGRIVQSNHAVTHMCHARIFSDSPDAMVQYSWAQKIPAPKTPRLGSQFAGGFNFGTAAQALDVRNDPYTPYLFIGEEYSKAARLWTHG
jgi:hypothetical protein